MKKTYITPIAEEIRIEKSLLTVTSSVGLDTSTELGDVNAGELLSRENDFEDDEDFDFDEDDEF
jgi:hypothetical protein